MMVMETYYRKRSKKPNSLTIMAAEQGSITALQSPVLGRHHHVPPPPSFASTDLQIKVGSVYEIDHFFLPPRTPAQLKSIRVIMVCETTEMNVSVRYPSMESLRAFFCFSKRETHPALDEKFVMGTALAAKVLVQLVPVEVFLEQKSLESFWLISSSGNSSNDEALNDGNDVNVELCQKGGGFLFDKLKGNGMMRWGVRRRVKYLGRHNNVNVQNSFSSFLNVEDQEELEKEDEDEKNGNEELEKEDEDDEEKVKEENEEQNEDEEEDREEENDEEKFEGSNINSKRKRYTFRNLSKKKPKTEKQEKQRKKKKKNQITKTKSKPRYSTEIVLKNPKDRWSSERYNQAEANLLEVMKAKEATAEKPVLRPELRTEARKKIGDTGLLDHLLKHMAGKVAPGGELRFRRRHNADGAMQYWLENADLVEIRREAGVADPYWVPPAGWKPGDSPNQDPICARGLQKLKDEIDNINRKLDLAATKGELEHEVVKLRREIDELSTRKRQEECKVTTVPTSSPSQISQQLEQLATSPVSPKSSDLSKPPNLLEKYKEQLLAISDFVKEIEEVQALNASGQETLRLETTKALKTAEQKAAKIQRLKSGFRICKPQGTFLWPADMVKQNINDVNNPGSNNNMVTVQVDVPTPPSVSSSTASAPPQLPWSHFRHPVSPVKPVAEKRAVTVTVSTNTSMINLNDAPMPPQKSPSAWEVTGFGGRNVMACNDSEQNKASCSSSSASTNFPWLALSAPKSARSVGSDGSFSRG